MAKTRVGAQDVAAADVAFTPNGSIAATNVQTAIQEVRDEAAGGGAPSTADYLVGTANGGLSAEIVVGTTPGGELGGTWASPTVDATHAGTTHSAASDTHVADTTAAHAASSIGFTPNGSIAATDVQAAIQEVRDEAGGSSSFVGWHVYNSANIALTNGSEVLLTYDTERFDTDGFHSLVTNTGRATIPTGKAGKYLVGISLDVTASAGVGSYATIRKNGTNYLASLSLPNQASVDFAAHSTLITLAEADYLEVLVKVLAASKNALASADESPNFWGHFLGA